MRRHEKNIQQCKDERREEEDDLTFRDVLFRWLQSNRIRLKEQTYAKYSYLIETHILPYLGQQKIDKIDAAAINRFIMEKSDAGRLDGSGGLSPSYVRTICFIISSALDFSLREGYRNTGIGDIFKPSDKKSKHEIEVLSKKEQNILEKYLALNIDNRKLGVLLSLRMGLRVGEVCGLRWSDVDLEDKTIHVRHTVERIVNTVNPSAENKTRLELCETKTVSSDRIIPIPSGIMPLIIKCQSENEFVLPGNAHKYTDPRTLQNSFHRYLDECQLRKVNYHCLRHTFATRCIEAKMDIKSLSELLGHANVNITLNIYVHSSLEHKREQMEMVSQICNQI